MIYIAPVGKNYIKKYISKGVKRGYESPNHKRLITEGDNTECGLDFDINFCKNLDEGHKCMCFNDCKNKKKVKK